MRPWLLLVSLLVSDLRPPGDGGRVMENHSWRLRRKLLLSGQMTRQGLEILRTQTEHHCMCIQRNCVHVAVQHKQRTSLFYWAYTVHDDHGCRLSYQKLTGMIHRSLIPAPVVSLLCEEGKRKSIPAFLLKSDTLPALHVISEITPTKAGGETSHIAMGIIKGRPDSGSAWFLHQHTAASGHNFQAFLLEKSKSWAAATSAHLQKMLTKRYCAATTVIISCCFEESKTRSALKIKKTSKEQITQMQRRQKESTQRKMDVKVLTEDDGQRPPTAAVSQRDIFQAATLHPGSSSVKTSDTSQLQMQSDAARIMKKNEHLNLKKDEESFVQKRVQRQQSLKAASSVYDGGDDGFYVERQRLLVSREKTESINRPQYQIRAAQDDNKEDFSGKIITKQAELRRPEGESQTERSHTNTIVNGNQKRLVHILQVGFTHKTDNDHKQTLTELGEEVLIMLFLPDPERETQTEPSLERKLIVNTDTGWKTLDDPPPMAKVRQENLIIEPENSKCKCLRERQFPSERYALDRTERIDIKPAESIAKVTPVSAHAEEHVEETTEVINTSRENMSINQTEQEQNVSVLPSPPSLSMMKTDTAKPAETTTVNTEIKEVTSSTEVFNPGSTQKADARPSTEETTVSPDPETDTEPRSIRCKTNNDIQAATEKSFSGLRMRENIPEKEDRAATNRTETERQENNDPKPPETIHKQATDKLPKTTDDNMPLCRGLIHRTKAAWKHCVERFAGMGSKTFSSREPTDELKDTGAPGKERTSIRDHKDSPPNDDEYDHFYYFDGVLRRVQNNFYPYDKRRRRNRRHDSTENSVFTGRKRGDAHENLLSYIRRLTLRN